MEKQVKASFRASTGDEMKCVSAQEEVKVLDQVVNAFINQNVYYSELYSRLDIITRRLTPHTADDCDDCSEGGQAEKASQYPIDLLYSQLRHMTNLNIEVEKLLNRLSSI